MSRVICHLSQMIIATVTDPPLLTPPMSTVGWSTDWWLQKPDKVKKMREKKSLKSHIFFKIWDCMSKLAICPLARGLHDLRKWVFCDGAYRQTDRQNHKHGNSKTDQVQRAESVKSPSYRGSVNYE